MKNRVLIVDDNENLNTLLQCLLSDEGYEVSSARHAEEGYAAYLRNRPDVILTDLRMPGGSGAEMVEKISTHDPAIRAVYMSGDWPHLQDLMKEEKRKPFVRFLKKPFSQKDLIQALSGFREIPAH